MVELPKQVAEALEPAIAEVDEFFDRVNGASADHPFGKLPKPEPRTTFKYGRHAPRD